MNAQRSARFSTLPRGLTLAGALASAPAALAADAPPGAQVRPVMQPALPNAPGDSLTAVVVQLPVLELPLADGQPRSEEVSGEVRPQRCSISCLLDPA